MDVLLFVDVLGVKSRWEKGGRQSAEALFSAFERFVREALVENGKRLSCIGELEADSAAIRFASADDAIHVGRKLFQEVFRAPETDQDDRLWIRGVITPVHKGSRLRTEEAIDASLSKSVYSDGLFDAINVERSGFKGMRLLIHNDFVTSVARDTWKIPVGERWLIPFRRLDHSYYPARVRDSFQDVLWMAVLLGNEWVQDSYLMNKRLRWAAAAGSSEEFMQAAATQVVFHECGMILRTLQYRAFGPEALYGEAPEGAG